MHITSVVIDGFKSYAQRTVINGFDPQFNAITGLNGSGKSNILDSICFLLGLTNLAQVRATNLQELVYKCGQAGVTTATVSITFDNQDKKQSPIGYESFEEIVVTRQVAVGARNKYMINGTTVTAGRVNDLFRSVQLNVNNPHFLIMQGRITKVLNMKPREILSMIEEAAGTRLYESKKEAALKIMKKKDKKLLDIDTALTEEITPTLVKLTEQRSSLIEYQTVARQLEQMTNKYTAYRYVHLEETRDMCEAKWKEMEDALKSSRGKVVELEEKVKQLSGEMKELEKKSAQESGDILDKLESNLKEKQAAHVKASTAVDHTKQALQAEIKKQKSVTKQGVEDKAALTSKGGELEKKASELKSMEAQSLSDQEAHTTAKNHYQAVSSGLSSNEDGEDASLNEQLIAARNDISQADTDIRQAQMKLKHAQEEIKRREADLKKTEQDYKKDLAAQGAVEKNIQKLQAEMQKLGYDEEKEERLSGEQERLAQDVLQLKQKLDRLEARFPQLQFDYKDPEKNFDRRKVHGLVCKLVQLKQPETALGLEVAAGGKLYNVVVDTEVTGKKLLQKGELRRRYTIIPLNKIAGRSINADTVKRAENLVGKENVSTALSLIGYEKDLQSAMEFVFGSSFVCKDMNVAKKVTFDEKVMKRSVTLDGNSFDPAGTLSGGARAQVGSILLKLQELVEAEHSLAVKQEQLAKVEAELNSMKGSLDRYRQLKQQYDLKENEAGLLKSRLEQSTHHQQLEQVNLLKQSVEEQKSTLSTSQEAQKKAKDKVKELENKLKNAKALREGELKKAEEGVTKAKKKLEESMKKTKQIQQEIESLNLEQQELEKDISGGAEQLKAIEEAIKGFEEKVTELKQLSEETKKEAQEAQAVVQKQRDLLKSFRTNLNAKEEGLRSVQQEKSNTELRIQDMEFRVENLRQETRDANKQVADLLHRNNWIADHRQEFGKTNTAFDFTSFNPKEASIKIQKMEETKEKIFKSVNMKAMTMLEKVEQQCLDLKKKRQVVLNDKSKIAATISELDKKKNEALKEAWAKVNKDFGSIFSSLLPGTQAKLMPPEGQTVLDGLEVKVAFGDVWKESLNELSGGQRSLVALSLILAMLLFKPAPIYILDEVDAALDLSHTQNIGQMIKAHFKHSQFIVVSLKDGMFNNANVLFRTKFIDGVSTVNRYLQNPSSSTTSLPLTVPTKKKAARKHLAGMSG